MDDAHLAVASLQEARELLAKPGGWTQGVSARKSCGRGTASWDPAAVQFCAIGALANVTGCGQTSTANAYDAAVLRAQIAARYLRRALGWGWRVFPQQPDNLIVIWNDDVRRTQAEVIAAFDRAIALAQCDVLERDACALALDALGDRQHVKTDLARDEAADTSTRVREPEMA